MGLFFLDHLVAYNGPVLQRITRVMLTVTHAREVWLQTFCRLDQFFLQHYYSHIVN